jgi:hypothetical protein
MFTIPMTAEIDTAVTHPAGVLLDSAGNPVLDASGEPVYQEVQS